MRFFRSKPDPLPSSSGETDAAVIFKPTPGSRRWQHMAREGDTHAEQLMTEDNYTVILGSHRNSNLKVEKSGVHCAMVRTRSLGMLGTFPVLSATQN